MVASLGHASGANSARIEKQVWSLEFYLELTIAQVTPPALHIGCLVFFSRTWVTPIPLHPQCPRAVVHLLCFDENSSRFSTRNAHFQYCRQTELMLAKLRLARDSSFTPEQELI